MKQFNGNGFRYKQQLEQNLYAAVKMFIVVCQIFGAAPVNLYLFADRIESVSLKNVLTAGIHYIWCTVIMISVSGAMYSQHLEFDVDMRLITRFLYTSVYFLTILNCLIIMFGCQYQKRWYSQYFIQIIDFDLRLQSYGGKLHFCSIKKFIRKIFTVTCIMFTLVIIIDFLYNEMIFVNFIRSITIYILPNLTVTFALIEYVSLLYLLNERYQQINYILERLCNGMPVNSQSNKRTFCILTVRPFVAQSEAFINLSYETIVNSLRMFHLDLCKLETHVNDSFGILLVSTLLTTFMILCTQMYAFYIFAENAESVDVYLFVYTVIWTILHAGKIYVILLWNHKVAREVSI